jgi:hypothetical protein
MQLVLLHNVGGALLFSGDIREVVQSSAAPAPTTDAVNVFDHNPAKPTWEGVRVAQGGQLTVGSDECFLSGILCQLPITQRGVAVCDGHVLEASDNRRIGVLVSQLHLGNKADQVFH